MFDANRITHQRLGGLPPDLRKTLTRDRGGENMGFAELEQDLGISCYFAHRTIPGREALTRTLMA